VGNLESYEWRKNDCLEAIENLAEGSILNFSELARTYGVKNKTGTTLYIQLASVWSILFDNSNLTNESNSNIDSVIIHSTPGKSVKDQERIISTSTPITAKFTYLHTVV